MYKMIEKYHADAAVINPIAIDETGNLTHQFKHDGQEYCWNADETLEQIFYQEKFDTTAWGKLYHCLSSSQVYAILRGVSLRTRQLPISFSSSVIR